jgi:hypothetical protein
MNNNTKLFVVYSDFLKCGLDEKYQTHLIYSYFIKFNKTVYIDPDKFLYNINGYYLEKITKEEDKDTKDYYSPIPLSILKKISKQFNYINLYNSNNSSKEIKKCIVDKLIENKFTKNSLINSLNDEKLIEVINNLYKPYCTSKLFTFDDFSNHYVRNNDLETFQNKKDKNTYEGIWLSNKSLLAFIKPFIENSNFHYIGVIHLKDFDDIKYEQLNDMYSRHKIKVKLENIIKSTKQRYIIGLVSSYDHWSSLCYDKEKESLYYFNSNGNLPTSYKRHDNYFFYCFINQYIKNKTCYLNNTHRYYKPIELVLDTFKAKQVFLNLNVSQLYSGFCGVFSIIFILLNILNPIQEGRDIKKVYSFYRFKSDYSMSLYRRLFFSSTTDHNLLYEIKNEKECNNLRLNLNIKE